MNKGLNLHLFINQQDIISRGRADGIMPMEAPPTVSQRCDYSAINFSPLGLLQSSQSWIDLRMDLSSYILPLLSEVLLIFIYDL